MTNKKYKKTKYMKIRNKKYIKIYKKVKD